MCSVPASLLFEDSLDSWDSYKRGDFNSNNFGSLSIFLGFFFFFLTVGDNQSFEMNSYIYIYSQIYVVPYVPGVQYKVLSGSSNKLP